jgi:hypothetical protein
MQLQRAPAHPGRRANGSRSDSVAFQPLPDATRSISSSAWLAVWLRLRRVGKSTVPGSQSCARKRHRTTGNLPPAPRGRCRSRNNGARPSDSAPCQYSHHQERGARCADGCSQERWRPCSGAADLLCFRHRHRRDPPSGRRGPRRRPEPAPNATGPSGRGCARKPANPSSCCTITPRISSTRCRRGSTSTRRSTVEQQDRDYHANRSRGMGGNPTTGAEENLLGYPGTRYFGEHIFVHEFAHAIHRAIRDVDHGRRDLGRL